jgi:hypothetical protein
MSSAPRTVWWLLPHAIRGTLEDCVQLNSTEGLEQDWNVNQLGRANHVFFTTVGCGDSQPLRRIFLADVHRKLDSV